MKKSFSLLLFQWGYWLIFTQTIKIILYLYLIPLIAPEIICGTVTSLQQQVYQQINVKIRLR